MAHLSGIGRRMLPAILVVLATALPALGQGMAGGFGGGGAGGGGQGGGGGFGGQGGAGGNTTFTGGSAFGGGGGLTGRGATTGGRTGTGVTSAPATSNFLASSFRYPYVTALGPTDTGSAQRVAQVQSNVSATFPSYGSPTFGTATSTQAGARGARGTATVRGGAAGANSGTDFNAGTTGQGPVGRSPHYAASVRFRAPIVPGKVLAEVREAIDRSTSIPSKARIAIQVDGKDVLLQGEVASDDERRHVEALIRLTPGVGHIQNDLVVRQ